MGFFYQKDTMLQLKNFRVVMCHDTEGWCKSKKKTDPWVENDIRNLISFHASSRKSGNLHFDGLPLSKAYKNLDEKVQKSYVSWQQKVMQNLKKKAGSWFQKLHQEFGELWRKTDFFFEKLHEEFVNFNASSVKSENLHFDRLLL